MNNYKQKILIKTDRLTIKYVKQLGWFFILLKLASHKNLSILIESYQNNFEQGSFSLGIDFDYRLKNVDHVGFDINLKLIFFKIDIEFSDDRHIEDYLS